MKRHINLLLALAAIVALAVTAVKLARWSASTKANSDALATMLEKNAALKARIDTLGPKPPRAPQTQSTARANDAVKIASRNATVREQQAQAEALVIARDERKANDREFGLKYYAALRSDVDTQYGPFYRLQHLTRNQTDVLAEALFQRQLRYEKIQTDWRTTRSEADAKTAKDVADAEFSAVVQKTLGEDMHEQFLLYDRQRPAWDYVGNYGGAMSLIDISLSLEQASRLAAAIASASTSFSKGRSLDMRTVNWNNVDAIAADFLTPEQLDFFKNVEVIGLGALFNPVSRQRQELQNTLQSLPSVQDTHETGK